MAPPHWQDHAEGHVCGLVGTAANGMASHFYHEWLFFFAVCFHGVQDLG